MLEVFHLPRGICKMAKKNHAQKVKSSPYLIWNRGEGQGLYPHELQGICLASKIIIPSYFCVLTTWDDVLKYNFVNFLRAPVRGTGKKRNWFDAFMFFFHAEIDRILKSTGSRISSSIGSHITLLMAHCTYRKEENRKLA